MYLLPKMCTKNLNERDLESGDLSMHEDSSQIQLHLEADVYIRTVDCWGPPKSEAPVWNLIQTRALGISEFLIFHRFLKAACFLPEQTFPCGEICSLEQSMLQNALNSSKRLDDIGSVIVQIPQLAIVSLVSPPEGIRFQQLILLPISSDSPTLVVSQGVTIFLKQSVDSGNASVPRILKIFQSKTSVLCVCLLPLQCIFSPYSL
mmetsp:Transcript_27924/g.90699  ORF Transcript_27924/g.90699 Transcript_27924/m.90699 type:complete len:205 (-) Transcript_27924:4267-4881(-)